MSIADITSVMDIFCELEKSSDSTESAESYLIDALDLLSAEVLVECAVDKGKSRLLLCRI